MRYLVLLFSLMLVPASAARADVDVSVMIGVPGVNIGINVPAYPRLVRVPGYPVYYDPYISLNLFFYDGAYWVFHNGFWYMSVWYNGPWYLVNPYDVPVYVLRVPVRYYRVPPPYFRGWPKDAPPRWDDYWGRDWKKQRKDWGHGGGKAGPPAPPPSYQREYSGERYPREWEEQRAIRSERYRYEPREPITREYYRMQHPQGGPPGKQKNHGGHGPR